MYALVGLGNPGKKYAGTRHNFGFDVIDVLAKAVGLSFTKGFKGTYAEGNIEGCRTFLLKPETYMNLSGESVGELVRFYKIETPRLLLIHDDLDLELGTMKIAHNGGDAGNKGVRSVYEHLGKDLWRLKLGIGRPPDAAGGADFVLETFSGPEKILWQETLDKAVQASRSFLKNGPEVTMNQFNKKTTTARS